MRYGVLLLLIAVGFAAVAAAFRGAYWLLAWPATAFLLVALAYLGLGPGIFGKNAQGKLAWWSVALLLPFLLLTWGVWHLRRKLSREACYHQVAPGLYVGRRAGCGELPADLALLVDLTAEFPASAAQGGDRKYLCVPVLDNTAGDEARLLAAVEQIRDAAGAVYIHCAQGHGRSAMLAAAVLMARGMAGSVEEAEEKIRAARAGVRLNAHQRELVRRVAGRVKARARLWA